MNFILLPQVCDSVSHATNRGEVVSIDPAPQPEDSNAGAYRQAPALAYLDRGLNLQSMEDLHRKKLTLQKNLTTVLKIDDVY